MTSWLPNRSDAKRGLERGLNALVIMACLALIGGASYSRFMPSRTPQSVADSPKGTKIKISGVEWNNSQRTVVLALSTHCHFCTASGDFYRRLQKIATARGVPIVALLPQPTVEARSYLGNMGLQIALVKQVPLESVNVSATPTLMIINPDGIVTDSWTGQLPSEFEKEVISKL